MNALNKWEHDQDFILKNEALIMNKLFLSQPQENSGYSRNHTLIVRMHIQFPSINKNVRANISLFLSFIDCKTHPGLRDVKDEHHVSSESMEHSRTRQRQPSSTGVNAIKRVISVNILDVFVKCPSTSLDVIITILSEGLILSPHYLWPLQFSCVSSARSRFTKASPGPSRQISSTTVTALMRCLFAREFYGQPTSNGVYMALCTGCSWNRAPSRDQKNEGSDCSAPDIPASRL